jgi:Zinc dependent phospholipase C
MKGLVFWREDPDTTNLLCLRPRSLPEERGQVGWRRLLGILIVALSCIQATLAYSVLTHEEIVDLVWEDQIRALLVSRFPGLSEEQIREAHAHAYGGSVIQDLGYYPFGSKDFSNLVHYVRSGDFVHELLRQSQDANEYAFALGALAHYTSDVAGHPAVNHAVAMLYPKLRSKFGNSVRFAQGKSAHLRTEFGFDVAQVANRRYASEQYHDFIGFKVSKPLLKRTFPIVYGLEMKDVLANDDLAISSYRFAVSTLIPRMTKIALQSHKKELMQETKNFDKQKFLYRLSRADYEKEWGKGYRKPGFVTVVLATILRCLPKVGPLKSLAFKPPTPQTEAEYFKSLNTTVDHYRAFLKEAGTNSLRLRNCDLDTGEDT